MSQLISPVFVFACLLLAACADTPEPQNNGPKNFYAERYNTPAAQAMRTPGTNQAYASGLSCAQIAADLNTLGREMGQVAAKTPIYKNAPNNLQLAEFITRMEGSFYKDELELTATQQTQIERLTNEYHSTRHAAYTQRCPVTAQLDAANGWAEREANLGWRRFDRGMETLDTILTIAEDIKDM